ncbi:MAG: glycosyl hydrolase [Planctomycetota bacterium]
MIHADSSLSPAALLPAIERMWALSAQKIRAIDAAFTPGAPAPVFTINGTYSAQGWTEWTEGFQHGSAALQFDATRKDEFLRIARERTLETMASHVTHIGVHDHGFNNVSTYGNLLRLARNGAYQPEGYENHFYELALKASGAVQASRWSKAIDGTGYIYSFNGPQSLFVDTVRSCRALAWSHSLGHSLMGERDESISLLGRLLEHCTNTARYSVYYGEGRDIYDIRGRTAHESLFNTNNGDYRAPSTQQGYSAFSTWTRGLAWAMCGFPEQLEFLETRSDAELAPFGGRQSIEGTMLKAALATCDFYLEHTPTCGVPYWDTGAPNLHKLGDYLDRPADPSNSHEPVDSSAGAIAVQGLVRLALWLERRGRSDESKKYMAAGLTSLRTLLTDTYLSTSDSHQGLLLHAVYHHPNGWDRVDDDGIPRGESCMWGDYHLREAALLVQQLGKGEQPMTFFGSLASEGVAS